MENFNEVSDIMFNLGRKVKETFENRGVAYKKNKYSYLILETNRIEDFNGMMNAFLSACIDAGVQVPEVILNLPKDEYYRAILSFAMGLV